MTGRKLLLARIKRIRSGITMAVKHWKNSEKYLEESTNNLKQDILNTTFHVFGHHNDNFEYFFLKKLKTEKR